MTFNHCKTPTSDTNITVQEKGRRANFRNPNNIKHTKIKVDGCVITDGLRADWIITKNGVGSVVVELKGKNIRHACDQLFATLEHIDCSSILHERTAMLIVCSRSPTFDSIVAKNIEKARKLGIRLKVVCNQYDNLLDKLLEC